MSKEFPFYDETISFSDELIRYNNLRSNFIMLGKDSAEEMVKLINNLEKEYEKNGDFEKFIVSIIEALAKTASHAIDFSIYVLMHYEIDTYSRDRFASLIGDSGSSELYEELGIWEPIETMMAVFTGIQKVKGDIADMRAEERSGRSQYVNLFSTNVRSAVSGEISAGIMNMGLSAVRGIKDAWKDAGDRKKIKALMDQIILEEDLTSQFVDAAINPYLTCSIKVATILWKENKFVCPFSDAFIDGHEAAMSRIRNYAEYGKKDVARKLIKEQLQLNPYNLELYVMMYELCGDDGYDLIRIAQYFDMEQEYEQIIEEKVKDESYFQNSSPTRQMVHLKMELEDYKKTYLA